MGVDSSELLIFKNRTTTASQQQPSEPVKQQSKKEQPKVQKAIEQQPVEQKPAAAPLPAPEAAQKSSKPDVKNSACVNHPWRPAYALCAYCGRPFCYADTLTYNKKIYCLEDIDQVSRLPPKAVQSSDVWAYLASIVLLATAVYLGYSLSSQLGYIASQIAITQFGFITNLTFLNYGITLLEALFGLLFFISALGVLRNTRGTFVFAGVVLGVGLLLIAYEYLSTSASYLFPLIGLTGLGLVILAASRMSNIGMQNIQEAYEGIDWPRVETF